MTSFKELAVEGITDCHTHSGSLDCYNMFTGNLPYTQSVDDLMLKAKIAGVENVITFPFPSTSYYNIGLLVREGTWYPSGNGDFPYQVENKILIRACEMSEGKIFPFLCIDPKTKQKQQIDFLSGLWDEGKFFGLKHHSLATHTRVSELIGAGFGDFMAEKEMPLIVHTSYLDPFSEPHHALEFAKAFPSVRVSIAHLGWLDEEVLDGIRKSQNLFTDCSSILQICNFARKGGFSLSTPNRVISDDPVETLVNYYSYLPDHLLWGTDEPWTTWVTPDNSYVAKYTYFDEIEVLKTLAERSREALEKIAVENPRRFIRGNFG